MSYLLNTWYMAAWSGEIGITPLRRHLIEIPVLLYRLLNGQVAALDDRCPHRFAPLSRGTRDGDFIRCGYHGLTFAASGQCIHNPFGERIPAGAEVRPFVTQERDGIVWLWTGAPAHADANRIPRFDSLQAAGEPARILGAADDSEAQSGRSSRGQRRTVIGMA